MRAVIAHIIRVTVNCEQYACIVKLSVCLYATYIVQKPCGNQANERR